MSDKPKVVVICGSSRFCQIMAVVGWLLEKDEGAIAMGLHLLPYWYPNIDNIPDHLAEHEGVSDSMDELHLRKIDLADEIFIVNRDKYIGESTEREIIYALKKEIPVRWYIEPSTNKPDPIAVKISDMLMNYNLMMNEANYGQKI